MANILSLLIATLAVVSPVAQADSYYPGAQSLDAITLYRCQSDGSVEKVHECYIGCIDGGDDNDGKCIAEIP
ncbi:hypothetical protein E4U56_005316 [Claviceps arundinis]|uniref:Secreted protein n=1 Tax=Claviceps arundinis TaxID=1623583 RepID=A0A9P7MW76_9HYPO|nr:hypothetical protein E4U56_005316 [Claviceps arundinis]